MATNNVDAGIASKVNEIKALPYAIHVNAEDAIDRQFGFRIIRNQVSSGRNSVVYKCQNAKFGDIYCIVKAYKLGKERVKNSLKEETCQIMRYVTGKCPQLISTMELFYTNEKIYLMSDWSARGEVLANMKQKAIKLNEEMLRNWTIDILNAIQFLHSNGICHRNIAPNCLLLAQENRIKIGTLSDAVIYCKSDGTLIKQKWSKFSRSSNWNQAPEVAKGKLYDPRRADIWSIGATVYWFITRLHPIDYRSSGKMTKQLEHKLSYMRKVTNKCQTFVKKLLSFQPSSRATLSEALQLEWITLTGGAPKEATIEIATNGAKGQDTGEAVGPEEVSPAGEADTSTSRKEEAVPAVDAGSSPDHAE